MLDNILKKLRHMGEEKMGNRELGLEYQELGLEYQELGLEYQELGLECQEHGLKEQLLEYQFEQEFELHNVT
jgi:hypothetical protein